jgi:exopolysaccharide biosynthesis polyprenyl glycosylphosphotransferase
MSTGINGIDHRRLRSQSLAYEPMVYIERSDLEGWQVAIKRAMDIAIASFVLVVSAPAWMAAAAFVKLYDRGPVFFTQERVGRHGKTFRMVKLRSMCIDAEAKLAALQEQNLRQGPLFKLARDPRVTPIGRILRATSVDELPQLINVLRGDMSLVGPRPALPVEVEKFDDALHARHNVTPGITGLWQVEGRDNPDFSLYQRFDIFYVENWSVALDISILFGTVKVVVMRAIRALHRERNRRGAGIDLTDPAAIVLD